MLLLDHPPAVAHNVLAGALLCVRSLAKPLGLPMPGIHAILSATGVTRSRAYELAQDISRLLPDLARPRGRPRVERPIPPPGDLAQLREEALRFVMSHPGCVNARSKRTRYSDEFRRFVLDQRERYPDLSLGELAEALLVPLGTLEDWFRGPFPSTLSPSGNAADEKAEGAKSDATLAQIESVIAAYRQWTGDFTTFCDHVRHQFRLGFGRTTISNILFAHGERTCARRGGRSRDEHALRHAFETFFPGAQWVADGKGLEIRVDGSAYRVNVELVVDASSGAAVGLEVTPEEDSDAVCAAFESGVETTGAAPLAMLLDNRPSNHTPEVDAALGDTMRMRSTPGRAQNKAHVEGAFGLFAQKVPPIDIDTRDHSALALLVARLIALVFFRALNRAPRRDRDGRTRVDLYAEEITPEQVEAARAALRERIQRQGRAEQTRTARLDPVMRALLDDAFERLEIVDPERKVRDAIACYPRDAVVDALAIFAVKRDRGTLPDGVDARYLFGIVKNVHHLHEADAILEALLRERLDARDRFLDPLVHQRDAILAASADDSLTIDALVDALIRADRDLDRHFWIDSAAALLAPLGLDQRHALARRAARRIHGTFRLGTRERHRLVRLFVRRLIPLN